ncbi:isochorismatase family protein [Baekduia soli]|uniref:Isochorismatase family protein n=1 Tax=Baekduia soli TaxID=496014 RepID=A0A5B8U5J7_9ACTN|nr:isochorismatase family protein [Baekduia soli]QEC48396.1 isochorismatase family protein [Baekduia soli]
MDSIDVYRDRGFGGRSGAGRHPALVVIDLCNGFTDPESPLHCDCEEAVAATARLLEAARAAGAPVAFTSIEYDPAGERIAAAFIAKAPGLLTLAPGTRWIEIDERIAPAEGEPVLWKLFASGFYGTSLGALLASQGCDTVIITGASTSGCVRATVVDALQHGYRVIVPREGVADRARSAHEASLADIDAKYGDVVGIDEAVAIFTAAAAPAA